ncbi:DNA primase [Mycoavidus cysteinexigens]|uniref:DNA primase n=1 Tax=Mycoavidus cysteinexigens TaxID=1553431 RepID=A0A2Z6EUU7_9BURK|nr:DNA primase [Mycoavidus cysteinexigens]BBE09166.1 DNA primase [Mycoavidus cysteinexigens]GAM52089.1 DNA primase [bacterium endosymbiont of Mortierella elongata FMR23-6]GLR01887.1 DNA primase [Mycoavidus cysteinexigens]
MIPHAFLQDLLNRIDIVEVVGKYVQLKKGGANFMGLCPFHTEKSPSFTVSPAKQFYHCFGCGAHGSAIGFLMEHTGLAFVEAVTELAQSAGLTVPHEPQFNGADAHPQGVATNPRNLASSLTDSMRQACDYYRKQLRGATKAIDYLKKRGLSGEVAARFGLGYAPANWQNLNAVFPEYRAPELSQAGLVIDSPKTDVQGQPRRYDRFRDRIMFPIRNPRGQVIGFGGRVIENGEPKYLNSPETPLFNKGSELYGLFEARMAIRDKGYVLVVEGYMDVVALAQLGFPNVVATLGTACTPNHVQKLLRQTDQVVFSFDGDLAGRRAARRALEASLPHATDNRIIRFLFLPAEHDPDSYLREYGAAALTREIEGALPLSQFLLNEILSNKLLAQPEGRAQALFDAKPLLQSLPANALRAQILHRLAAQLELPLAEVTALCKFKDAPPQAIHTAPVRSERRRVTDNEQRALRNLIAWPRIAHTLDEEERHVLMHITRHKTFFGEVLSHAQALGSTANFSVLSDLLRNSRNAPAFEEIFREILVYDENVRDLMHGKSDMSHMDTDYYQEQERLAGVELRAAIIKLRYSSLCERREHLARQLKLSAEEAVEFAKLLQQTAELKQRLAVSQVEKI